MISVSIQRNPTQVVDRWNRLIEVAAFRHPVLRDQIAYYLATQLLRIIDSHLEEQDLPWPPLSPAYAERKARKGLDPRIWVATSELRSYFAVWKTGREPGSYAVGIPRHLTHKESGLPAWQLAAILEFGVPDHHLPARPLMRPSLKDLRRWVKNHRRTVIRKYTQELERITLGQRGLALQPGQIVYTGDL